MKHTIQTLKKNLTLAEVEALEKELREELKNLSLCRSGDLARRRKIKEILGK